MLRSFGHCVPIPAVLVGLCEILLAAAAICVATVLTSLQVGAIIRRFCIDEPPQLWNVSKGHMSVAGPRPPSHSPSAPPCSWPCFSLRWRTAAPADLVRAGTTVRLDLPLVREGAVSSAA